MLTVAQEKQHYINVKPPSVSTPWAHPDRCRPNLPPSLSENSYTGCYPRDRGPWGWDGINRWRLCTSSRALGNIPCGPYLAAWFGIDGASLHINFLRLVVHMLSTYLHSSEKVNVGHEKSCYASSKEWCKICSWIMVLGPPYTRNHAGLCCAFLCYSHAVLCGTMLHYFWKFTATGSRGTSVPCDPVWSNDLHLGCQLYIDIRCR